MRTEGPTALFRGLTPIMLRAFPANAVSYLWSLSEVKLWTTYMWQSQVEIEYYSVAQFDHVSAFEAL